MGVRSIIFIMGWGGRGRENLVSDSSCYWECSCDGRLGCLTLIHIVHEKVGRLAFDGSSLNKFKQRRVEVSTGVVAGWLNHRLVVDGE